MMYYVRDLDTGLVYDIEGEYELLHLVAYIKDADIDFENYINDDFDDLRNQCSYSAESSRLRMYDKEKKTWIVLADAENQNKFDWIPFVEAAENLNQLSGVFVVRHE